MITKVAVTDALFELRMAKSLDIPVNSKGYNHAALKKKLEALYVQAEGLGEAQPLGCCLLSTLIVEFEDVKLIIS
jgi:hypothetical protein